MYYRRARLETAALLEERVASGMYRGHDDAPLKLVKFILARMSLSPHTTIEYKEYAETVLDKLVS